MREQRLAAGRVFGFALNGNARVRCLSGELWVTGPDTGDLVVVAGESVRIQGTGRVVVEALRDARLDVSP